MDRQLASSCPIPALSPKSTEYPSSLLGHSPIASSSFQLLGTKRKRVQSRGLKSLKPCPSCQKVCPLPKVVRVKGRLLADHSLVKVDVAQVLGWLFGGTHFLVIVDHPSGRWEGTEKDNKMGMPSCIMFVSRAHLRSLRCFWARIPTFFFLCCDPQMYIPARSLKGALKSHTHQFPFDVILCIYLETGSQQFWLSWNNM